MKRVLLTIGIMAQLVMSQTSHAITFTDTQNFWPTWASTSDLSDNAQDVIGHPNITGGTATIEADRTLSQITFTQDAAFPSWSDLYSTDLFINVLNNNSDTTWDYLVKGGKVAGDYALYNITAAGLSSDKGVSPLSDYIITSATELSIRNDHPTGVTAPFLFTTSGITPIGTALFAGMTDALTTSYDFNNGTFTVGDIGFIVGWGVNCANDVIYEQVPVPEPGTMMLLGFGMLSLAIYGKRRMNKEA